MPNTPAPTAPAVDSKKSHFWILISLALALLLIGAWLIHRNMAGPAPKASTNQAIPVGSAAVTIGSIDVYLDGLGTVTPVYTATIVSQVSGQVVAVPFKEGQLVKKGDLLAVIDPRPYRAVVREGQGQLARDQATLKNARIDLVRYQNSYAAHAIPQQTLATQQATVEQDEGTVKLDEGTLAAAQVNLDFTRIVAPIDGRVGLRDIDPGNVVTADGTTALCVVTQLQPITVIFTIAEDSIDETTAQMATGRKMPVIALDRSKQHQLAAGTLLTVDNQVNTTTGTVRVRASFPNTHYELFPNQFVNARLLVKTLSQVNLVPQAAIQRNNNTAFVYVEQPDSTVKSTDVTILATEGETSAVTGVNPGDKLVTDGFDKLQNGSKIVQRDATPAEANTTTQNSG